MQDWVRALIMALGLDHLGAGTFGVASRMSSAILPVNFSVMTAPQCGFYERCTFGSS